MTPPHPALAERVTPLELFFDLVFVFTITQLTALLSADASLAGLLRVLLLLAVIWWMYGGDDARAEHALTAAPAARRPRMAIEAFGYWHLPILPGIIATAAGMETAIAHPYEPLGPAMALALAGGVALFLAGDVLFRRSLEIGGSRWRAGGD